MGAYCIPCKEKGINAEYIGETGKSLHQRSVSHYEAFRYRRTHSFMIRHQVRSHPLEDLKNTRFGWEVISKEPTCLRRQVSEAIRIKESRDKESLQRDQIINQYLAKPKPEPEPNPKPKPEPPPEEYILPLLTHINLNDKLEYNRSTIPFPDDKPPTDDEIRTDKNKKAKI